MSTVCPGAYMWSCFEPVLGSKTYKPMFGQEKCCYANTVTYYIKWVTTSFTDVNHVAYEAVYYKAVMLSGYGYSVT